MQGHGHNTDQQLKDRDFTIIIDKSGSMSTTDCNGKSRWETAHETTLGLANKAAQFDPDGLTLYHFNNHFKRTENVKPGQVDEVWKENDPSNGTTLAPVLKDAFDNYFYRKERKETKANGEMFLVITDGQPEDEEAVAKTIVAATKKMDKNEELGIMFLQIGSDPHASAYLKRLDDGLQAEGAKFDIVTALTSDEIGNMTLTDAFLKALND